MSETKVSKKVRKEEAKNKLVEKKAEDKAEDKAGNACVAVMHVIVRTHAWGGTGSQPGQHRACALTNTASACAAGMHVHTHSYMTWQGHSQSWRGRIPTRTCVCLRLLACLFLFYAFVILRICSACMHVCLC